MKNIHDILIYISNFLNLLNFFLKFFLFFLVYKVVFLYNIIYFITKSSRIISYIRSKKYKQIYFYIPHPKIYYKFINYF